MNELIDTTEMYLRTIYELEEEGVVPLRARIAERLAQSGPTVSQTVARMERDGLVVRTVHPVVPPKVEYRLTQLGMDLSEAFCGVWTWAARNVDRIEAARRDFDARASG